MTIQAETNVYAGTQLRSTVCDTEVIVVKAPKAEVDVRCGGVSMVLGDADRIEAAELRPDMAGGSLLGKRYADEELGLELLVTKGGQGTLSVGDEPLTVKETKKLPSSD